MSLPAEFCHETCVLCREPVAAGDLLCEFDRRLLDAAMRINPEGVILELEKLK